MAVGVELIVELRHLHQQGLSVSAISRRLHLDRKTVRKYLRQREAAGRPVQRTSKLDPFRPYLEYRLAQWPELSAARLCREIQAPPDPAIDGHFLLPASPYEGSERTVRRYVARIRPVKPTRDFQPVETLPGEEAQVDWGHCGHIVADGGKRPLYVFSLVLSYCRVRYVEFTTSQDMATFLGCHARGLHYLGGVPVRILYDHAKTVVADRVGSVVQFNRDLLRFALDYGFHPTACWLQDPESKGKTENSIGYVKRDFLYSRPVEDLPTLNAQALAWCDEVANEKVHGATREVPADRLAEERRALRPLPERPVPIFMQLHRVIRKDHTFSFETNQYSVPAGYAGRRVILEVDRDRVQVYADGVLIADHRRCHDRGRLILDEAHIRDRSAGRRRRMSRLQERFEALGPEAPAFLKGLARARQGRLSEQARQILALAEAYGTEAVHQAMERAAAYGRYSYGAVKRIVEAWDRHPDALPEDPRREPVAVGAYTGPTIEVETRSPADYAAVLAVSRR